MGRGSKRHPLTQRWLQIMMIGSMLISFGLSPCRAQCVEFTDRASLVDLDAFVKSPSSLLQRMRNDKEQLKYRLSSYIATDVSTLASVQTLIAESGSRDRTEIGSALRLAEALCTATKPDAARKIKDFAQRIGDLSVQAGYTATEEDRSGGSQPRSASTPVKPLGSGALLEGEWNTRLADPFKPVSVPR